MNLLQKFRSTYDNKNKITENLILLILLFLSALFYKNILFPAIAKQLKDLYSDILLLLVSVLNNSFKIDLAKNILYANGNEIVVGEFFFSSMFVFMAIFLVFMTDKKLFFKIIMALGLAVFFTLYNVLLLSFFANNYQYLAIKNWLFTLFQLSKWAVVFAIFYLFWPKDVFINSFFRLFYPIDEIFWKKLILKSSLIVVSYYLVVVIMFNNLFILSADAISNFLLKTSSHILDFFNIQTNLKDRLLYNSKAALYMEDSCIGIDLMFVFASFILLIPYNRWSMKLLFILAGVFIILIMNIARIVFVFLVLYKNNNVYTLPIDWHDVFTFPVLLLTVILWDYWVRIFIMPYIKQKIQSK